MAGLFGSGGTLEQLFLWSVASETVSAMSGPMLTALQQDMAARHPLVALTPQVAAEAVARHLLDEASGHADAARGGIDGGRFATLTRLAQQRLSPEVLASAVERHLAAEEYALRQAEQNGMAPEAFGILRGLAKVRLPPADLATAVLRSYMGKEEAEKQAEPQGITPHDFSVLADLAGDAPGPQELVTALRRGLIERHGKGPGSTSYEQGIAESRLHGKWARMLDELGAAVLSPADAASAVVRNFVSEHDGQAQAAKSGVDRQLFEVLRHLAGDSISPGQAAEALRRGAIHRHGTGAGSTSFEQAIAEGRLADKWAPVIEVLAKLWPTPVDALNAQLKGQIGAEEGRRLYEKLGGDLQFHDWLLHSQGEGPTPLEAADWARRGIIPWDGTGPEVTSYAQAVRESRFRDKWARAYKASAEYIPPPGEISALYERHAIDRPTAARWWAERGLTKEQITAYLRASEFSDVADTRGLTVNAVLTLYYDQIVGQAEAAQLLSLFAVPQHNIQLLLEMTGARREMTTLTAGVRRIVTLLTSRKITAQTAAEALGRLGVPGAAIPGLVETAQVTASVNVKVLTEAQIADGFERGIATQDEAMADLEAIGYTPYDAWYLLSVKMKTALPNKPPRGPGRPPVPAGPGTTG